MGQINVLPDAILPLRLLTHPEQFSVRQTANILQEKTHKFQVRTEIVRKPQKQCLEVSNIQ